MGNRYSDYTLEQNYNSYLRKRLKETNDSWYFEKLETSNKRLKVYAMCEYTDSRYANATMSSISDAYNDYKMAMCY